MSSERSNSQNSKFSETELSSALKEFEPGNVPESVWQEMLRLNGGRTIELVPLRIKKEKLDVFMIQRPNNDPVWPNMLHCSGIILNGQESFEEAFERLLSKEILNEGIVLGEPKLVWTEPVRKTPRGNESVFVYLGVVAEGGDEGKFYDTENLPENTILHHKEMIERAVDFLTGSGRQARLLSLTG